MIKRFGFACVFIVLLGLGCSKRGPGTHLQVEIPAEFTGNFVLAMGIHDAPPLEKDGSAYIVVVPRRGKVETWTFRKSPTFPYKNSGGGQVWGYQEQTFITGD